MTNDTNDATPHLSEWAALAKQHSEEVESLTDADAGASTPADWECPLCGSVGLAACQQADADWSAWEAWEV